MLSNVFKRRIFEVIVRDNNVDHALRKPKKMQREGIEKMKKKSPRKAI